MAKIALITGANKGIGLETARQLARDHGFTVILGSRDVSRGQAAAKSLRESGLDAHALRLDVTDADSIRSAAREIEEKFGHLDVLINNAGVNLEYSEGLLPSTLPLDALRRTYETNVFGAFSVLQAMLPLLQHSPAPRVVNVSSTIGSLAHQSNPEWFGYAINTLAYSSSKAALNSLTIAFAKEFRDTPMKINSAHPGWVKTDLGTEAAPVELEDGPRVLLTLATLPAEGPTGQFFEEEGPLPW